MSLAVSPHGLVYLDEQDDADPLPASLRTRVEGAFARGMGHGILHLGAVEIAADLPPPFAYFRELAKLFLAALCAMPGLEEIGADVVVAPDDAHLDALASSAPPMRGSEYVSALALRGAWSAMENALRREVEPLGNVASYLRAKSAVWTTVGRVCLHLAENKRDESAPFAFLATYTTHVVAGAKVAHRPLGKALEEYAGAGKKSALLQLLLPIQRAAERSALLNELVASGDIYHALAWTPVDALAFLKDVPLFEASGLVVRVPNWWRREGRARPEVTVTVGKRPPSELGARAMLDFSVDVTLDGETLDAAERNAILRATSGLALVKGKWVEIDHERLEQVLAHWKDAERAASHGGLSFLAGMRLLSGAPLEADANALDEGSAPWSKVVAGSWLADALQGLRSPEGLRAIDPGAELHAKLRPYQKVGVGWLAWLQALGLGGCLADDMGLGKTIQVLSLLLLLKRGGADRPSLLVVPASLVANWRAEAERFAPSLRLSTEDSGADVVVTTYGALTRQAWLRERDWNLVVLDEAQAIKNPGAKQTRAAKALRSRTRLALTGTPVENRLGDLWSLFDFLSPGLLGAPKEFSKITRRLAGGPSGYAPLRRLVQPYILRRMKSDKRVVDDLPDKTEVRAYAPLTKTQAALYEQAVTSLAHELNAEAGVKRKGAILASILRFKQICNHPSQWLGDGVYDPRVSGKFARLREIAEPIAARQEKVLVFTQFREMTAPLAAFLATIFGRPGLVLSGSTAVKARQGLVDAFQEELGPPFFVLSIKAGGTGLNLTAASHVIHFDRWWNPAVENQATDRAYRIGQKKNVLVHKLVCKGTIEEKIDALLESKRGLSDALIEAGTEVPLTEMSNDELMKLVALDLASAVEVE